MLTLSLTVLPIFMLLLFGALLQRKRFPVEGFWPGVDKLVYWVMFPAMLFYQTSRVDLSSPVLPSYASVLAFALVSVSLFVLAVCYFSKVDKPTGTSVLQAGVRFNTFISLAVASALYGEEGLILATLGAAILIPTINVFLVISMVSLHGQQDASKPAKSLPSLLVKELFKNPLILAIMAGISVNLLGIEKVFLLTDITGILARATLPLVLLAVGASLRMQAFKDAGSLLIWSSLARLLVFPFCIALACTYLELDPLAACVAILFGAVPTATSGYALAKQLGGNAPIMSVFINVQTGLSVVTLPLTMWLAQIWFGLA
ncbi:transporter [Marinomonas sp. SBI22]|uniref:AEC family transporter n=1 Tax=unclassified Marinomonas TaxID=196814 RepID=UPI0007BB01EF|nr:MULTISPECIES: AEC family transporter [unclassified Marinomonas]KZM44366.1 transporter [Marinomonas sp. SBI22]KZM45524.1 transporter [Marinomonas sp. SBI8L]